jgi:hypothetical protein
MVGHISSYNRSSNSTVVVAVLSSGIVAHLAAVVIIFGTFLVSKKAVSMISRFY